MAAELSRIRKELNECARDQKSGVTAGCVGDSLNHLEGTITGPDGTPYEGRSAHSLTHLVRQAGNHALGHDRAWHGMAWYGKTREALYITPHLTPRARASIHRTTTPFPSLITCVHTRTAHTSHRRRLQDRHHHPVVLPVRAAQDEIHHQDLAPQHLLLHRRHLPGACMRFCVHALGVH
jgi:hypothetical protein